VQPAGILEHHDSASGCPPFIDVGSRTCGQSLSISAQTTTIESINHTVNQMYNMSHQTMKTLNDMQKQQNSYVKEMKRHISYQKLWMKYGFKQLL